MIATLREIISCLPGSFSIPRDLLRAVRGAAVALVCLFATASPVRAQAFELTPVGGYRFGNDFFEIVTQQPVDLDVTPALGFVLDVPLSDGLHFETLLTHQHAQVSTFSRPRPSSPPERWNVAVDYFEAGASQELQGGPVRPFLSGLFGLTRYATEGDSEFRLTIGAGGGVKVFPVQHVGFRLDSRLFATFVDASTNVIACGGGGCLATLHLNVVWQLEFTAGIVVRFH